MKTCMKIIGAGFLATALSAASAYAQVVTIATGCAGVFGL